MLGTANAVSESSTLDPSSRGLWSTAVPAAPAAAQPTTGPFGLPLEQKTVIEGFVVPPKFSDSLHAVGRC